MSLSRVKVWIPGDILTASDLNAEFNNILDNPLSLISPSTGAMNFGLQAHTGLVPSAISASSGSAGAALIVNSAGTVTIWGSPTGTANSPSKVLGLLGFISSQSATFAANSYVMRTTGNTAAWTVTATSSFGASVGTAGPAAGGRDQAAVFASTYVHWYAISTGSASTAPAGLVSSQPPTVGPTMPTDYSGWTYLGASVYSSSSTTVTTTHRFVSRTAYYPESGDVVLTAGGAATSFTALSLSSAIPPNSLSFYIRGAQTTAAANLAVSIDGTSTFFGWSPTNSGPAFVQVPQTSDGLRYMLSAAGGSANIRIVSYNMPNGDV